MVHVFSKLVSLPRNAYWVKIFPFTRTAEGVIGKPKARGKAFISLSQKTEQIPVSKYILVTAPIPAEEMPMAWQPDTRRYTPASLPQWFSAAFGLVTHQKDHLTILLRNNEDKNPLGSRIPFDLPSLISAINYLQNFKVLKLVKYTRAKVEFVCLLSIIYTVCFTISDV